MRGRYFDFSRYYSDLLKYRDFQLQEARRWAIVALPTGVYTFICCGLDYFDFAPGSFLGFLSAILSHPVICFGSLIMLAVFMTSVALAPIHILNAYVAKLEIEEWEK